jgi:threonylcarbamoyladenosine tRNA methylthiotransferase MtaB
MKYSVITFGCRVNQADSLGFEEELVSRGASAAALEEADLVVVNTCSVTASADQAARQTIRRVTRVNPDAKIVVTGCYATRRPGDVRDLPNVTSVLANPDKSRVIPLALAAMPSELTTSLRFAGGDGPCGDAIAPGIAGRTAFTLRVQTGCSQPCAYCIIPTTRGEPKSVTLEVIEHEIARVYAAGFKEIALTGVHLGSYGRDLMPASPLVDLLTRLDVVRAERWPELLFRISSLEPMDCTREVVDLVAAGDSFAPHFHLPLQHASEQVLRAMRRPYTVEYYRALVDDIRARIPRASIGSDIIVGFPGETDADFDEMLAYLERSPLTHLHVFPYSDRPGTAAASLAHKVDGAMVRERARLVRDVGQRLSSRFRASQRGTIHRALTIEDGTLAVTGNYQKVKIPAGRMRNEWVTIEIGEAGTGQLLDGGR